MRAKKINKFLKDDSESLREEAMGGVSAPMSTLNNTPGMGTVQPADAAATTSAQQASGSALGSGDNFGDNTLGTYTQDGKTKKSSSNNKKKKTSDKKGSSKKKSNSSKKNSKKSTKKNENFHIETLDEFMSRSS